MSPHHRKEHSQGWAGASKSLEKKVKSFTALDKIESVINSLKEKYPSHKFNASSFPPVTLFSDNSFDTIISFQVIEHIKDDVLFIKEIYRLLRSGGKALVTTPNILMTLTRNPWHIREYTSESLLKIALKSFDNVEIRCLFFCCRLKANQKSDRASYKKIYVARES